MSRLVMSLLFLPVLASDIAATARALLSLSDSKSVRASITAGLSNLPEKAQKKNYDHYLKICQYVLMNLHSIATTTLTLISDKHILKKSSSTLNNLCSERSTSLSFNKINYNFCQKVSLLCPSIRSSKLSLTKVTICVSVFNL